MDTAQINELLAGMKAEGEATLLAVPSMRTSQRYRTGFGGELIVNHIQYAPHTTEAEVLAGHGIVVMAELTQDGRNAITTEWHDGAPSNDEWVYVERWTMMGRTFHGYVDSESRKVVQTG